MRKKAELETIKDFVDSAYNSFGNILVVNASKAYDPGNTELGYCYKFKDPSNGNVTYKIYCSTLGIPDTDLRVLLHEYGHIYLGHLEEVHEELDVQICNAIRDHRTELIEYVNKSCGIDFADKLLERIIDDPSLNHSLHNIAMDMEVNTSVLSDEDIEAMEKDISSVLAKKQIEELNAAKEKVKGNPDLEKAIEESIDKMKSEALIKLILPCRYYLGKDDQGNLIPFPSDCTYTEYLMLIIQHLDQFVKMLVSIKMGGNGDTSQISQRDVQNALNNMNRDWKNASEEYKQGYNDAINDKKDGTSERKDQADQNGTSGGDYGQGYQDAMNDMASGMGQGQGQGQDGQGGDGQGQGTGGMQSLSDLMKSLGVTDDNTEYRKGIRDDVDQELNSPRRKDHGTDARDEADKKREVGQIRAGGGVGCGNSGGPDAIRDVDKDVDEVDMALREVFQNFRNRVVKQDTQKDMMKLYNRGIIRSVIAPSVSRKVTITTDPKIVYLIDISGSMDTQLVDRILKTIAKNMKKLSRGLKYDIISWSTCLGEHIKDIDPKKGVPRIRTGGGTRLATGIKYFKDNYGPEATLVVISDFEDCLDEWNKIESTMPEYTMYGFNYGGRYSRPENQPNWKYMKVRNFNR